MYVMAPSKIFAGRSSNAASTIVTHGYLLLLNWKLLEGILTVDNALLKDIEMFSFGSISKYSSQKLKSFRC